MKTELLLSQTLAILKKYEETSRITGNSYNLFEVAEIQTNELVHTKFIADLLNPKGLHGQGDTFLKMFFEGIKESNHYQPDFKVYAEKSFGQIDWVRNKGGNIDILLKSALGKSVVIENKLEAIDQPQQLIRYYNTLDKNCFIYYLTIEGKAPSKNSVGGLEMGTDFELISYSKHIIPWVEKCIAESINFPILKETLRQYLNLLLDLCGKSPAKMMKEEIAQNIISSCESLEYAFVLTNSLKNIPREDIPEPKLAIRDSFEKALEMLTDKFLEQLSFHFSGFKFETKNEWRNRYWHLYLYNSDWSNFICISLERGNFEIGVCRPDAKKPFKEEDNLLFNKLQEFKLTCKTKPTINDYPSFVWFIKPKERFAIGELETMKLIINNQLAEKFASPTLELLNFIKERNIKI